MILLFVLFTAHLTQARAGDLPLESSHYDVQIIGGVAEIELEQVFYNDSDEFIEAIYTFPLDGGAAVDAMSIRMGLREIVGEVQEREEARKAYEEARSEGKAAGLTEQQRPNIFTQSVANIPPGEEITVSLHVVQPIERIDGAYELVIPLVVGPRFSPIQGVSDVEEITPEVARGETGVDVDIDVDLLAGVQLSEVLSPTHEVDIKQRKSRARVQLEDARPHKDFVLRWSVESDEPMAMALEQDDHMMVRFEPPETPDREQVIARELIWVIDTSGSQDGMPLDMSKDAMHAAFDGMNDNDRFSLIQFADDMSSFSDEPVWATPENIEAGRRWLDGLTAGGGTNMVEGVYGSLDIAPDPQLERYVVFLTDGLIGNEAHVLATIEDRLGAARLFTFGLGYGTNRWLLEEMAIAGGGRATFVMGTESPEESVERFMEGIDQPVLSDIEVDWGDWKVDIAHPNRIGDLMAGQPLEIMARVDGGSGPIRVTGRLAGRDFAQEIQVQSAEGTGIASLWARAHVASLTRQQHWGEDEAIKTEILTTALEYQLLTRYTSFVAIDRRIVNPDGELDRVDQPSELPEGMNYETSVSRTYTPPGDPLLTVDAPADARSVLAVYPWGETRQMRWDELRERWYDRFLVPRDVPDGEIEIVVFIYDADGSITRRVEQMVVDSEADELDAWIEHDRGTTVLYVVAEEPLRSLQVQPLGRPDLRQRVNVILSDDFEHRVVIPGTWDEVELVVSDRAMNTLVQRVHR
jgi:Ca-activated chloride channel family protein